MGVWISYLRIVLIILLISAIIPLMSANTDIQQKPPSFIDTTSSNHSVIFHETGSGTYEYAPDRLLVKYNTDLVTSQEFVSASASLNAQADASVMTDYTPLGLPGLELVRIGSNNVSKAMEMYSKSPYIEYAEPDYLIRMPDDENNSSALSASDQENYLANIPNDTYFNDLWGMHNTGQNGGTPGVDINAPEAWRDITGSKDIIIAVIDSGVDYTHPDLAGNMWVNSHEIPDNGIDDDGNGYVDDYHGYSFDPLRPDPMATDLHGTHCAGTIGAVGDNGLGVCGVNWHTSIMPLNTYNVTVEGHYTSSLIAAYLYADMMGARITSNSYGGAPYSQAWSDIINSTHFLMVCAAMNEGSDNDKRPVYPADYQNPNIISVGSIDSNNYKSWFSNYGKTSVDLMAPGGDIYSTSWGYEPYSWLSGTSMATPHVAGVAGLLLSWNPYLTNKELVDRILSTTDPIGDGNLYPTVTNGRVNAAHALYWNSPPEINSVYPNHGYNNHTVAITNISGNNLFDRSIVNLTRQGEKNITAINVAVISPHSISCLFPITGASVGTWNISVTNPYGQTFELPNGFTVSESTISSPVITGIIPALGQAGTHVPFTLTGSNFDYVNTVNLSRNGMADISAVGTLQGNNLTGVFIIPYIHSTDLWNVTVNQSGSYCSISNAFTVLATAPAPQLSRIEPNFSYNSHAAELAIIGSNFVDGIRVALLTPYGYIVPNYTQVLFSNSSFVSTSFGIWGFTPGNYTVILTNPDDQQCSQKDIFTILDAYSTQTVIESITPSSALNNTFAHIEINGSFLSPSMNVCLEPLYSYDPIVVNYSPWYDDQSGNISATLDLHGIPTGSYEIKLINTTTDMSSFPFPFDIMYSDVMVNATSDRWTKTFPSGVRMYPSGTNASYYTQARPGSILTDVLVNNASVGAVPNWTFTDLGGNQTIESVGNPIPGQVMVFFTGSPTYGAAPHTVQFNDSSLGSPTSWYWQFGDGSSSTAQNSSHTYTAPGVYSVTLRARSNQSGGVGEWSKYVTVTNGVIPSPTPTPIPGNIEPNFIVYPIQGRMPLSVQFTDISTGNPTSWYWDFGDGVTSTSQNTTHQYAKQGSYDVTFLAKNEISSGNLVKSKVITVIE